MAFLHDLVVHVILTTPLVGAYTMFALGIVLIYRSSKVLNLAHGAMAMVPAYAAYTLAPRVGLIGAVGGALALGAVLGVGIERAVVRRLRSASTTAQTVGTVGVFGLLIAVVVRGWGTTPLTGVNVFPDHRWTVGSASLRLGDIGLLVVALASVAALSLLFRYTEIGLAMRGVADHRRAARLMGIDPDRMTALAWLLGGVFAALGGVLLSASIVLHPYVLSLQVLPAFVAALLGGLENVTGALYGSIIVGLVIGVVPTLHGLGDQTGMAQVVLTVLACAVMYLRGMRFSVAASGAEA